MSLALGLPVAVISAAVLGAGCARPTRDATAAHSSPAPESGSAASVSLERGPCFGACPVYRVSIDGSGGVAFEGRRFVADTGTSTGTVARGRVDSLLTELDRAGYFSLADRYGAGDAACGRYATDLPTVVTEVHFQGRAKRVEHDHGCAGAPAVLDSLERRIDEVAGVRRWVGR